MYTNGNAGILSKLNINITEVMDLLLGKPVSHGMEWPKKKEEKKKQYVNAKKKIIHYYRTILTPLHHHQPVLPTQGSLGQ